MKRLSKKLLYMLGIFILCGGTQLQAQSLDQAKKLYNEGKYAEAKPAFEKLIKQAPSNPSYNQWYGVCCFETGDMANAEKHLGFAAKRKVQEAYRYMGEMYYQTYRFDEAVEMFEEYINLLTKKKQDIEPFQISLDLANRASRMLDKVEDIQIIDSMVVAKDNFLSAYTLSEESGSLTAFKDFFQANEANNTPVYMNQKGDKIYYAHATDNNQNCLFTQSRLMEKWGDEKQLPMNINSHTDDGYPFVLSDGVTIYYASKGHGSLGGYDLFVTRYNISSDSYLTPEQLGMPYNSPFNDYMIVIDEVKQLGWFVSDRYQPEDKVCVYLFVPNENRARIDSDDQELKRARAAITSIQDSRKPGSDYEELVRLAHMEIPYGNQEAKKDFTFPINNDLVYYTLNDFRSPEAKSYYEKVTILSKQINDLGSKLSNLRTVYTKSNSTKRQQLKPSILQVEEQLESLLYAPDEWEKKSRNAEITFLKNKR